MSSLLKTLESFAQLTQPFLIHLPCVLGLAIRPRSIAILITFPLLLWIVWQSLLRAPQSYGEEYGINGYIILYCFIWLDWLVLGSPDREKWKRADSKDTKGDRKKYIRGDLPKNFTGRLKFAVQLTVNPRLIGWSSQVAKVPKGYAADMPRHKAILRKVLRVIYFVGVIALIKFGSAQTSYATYYDHKGSPRPEVTESPSLIESMLFAWLYILSGYAGVEAVFAITAAVCLALGSPVGATPPGGGDATQMYTVRKCWGEVWHGLLKRICTAPGTYLAHDVLGLPRGVFLSKYIKLFVAFFVSACLHSCAAMLTNRAFEENGEFVWFFGQAFIILIEDHIILMGKKLFGTHHSRFWQWVGYAWVVVWYGLSIQPFMFAMFSRGMSMVS